MTTIAWDGKTLAGDRRITVGTMSYTGSKLVSFPDGSVGGFAGAAAEIQQVVRWMTEGCEEEPPDVSEVVGIVVDQEHAYLVEGSEMIPLDRNQPLAVGSGDTIALAFMRCGLPAQEAVLKAASVDRLTGDGVDTLEPADPEE